MKKKIELGTAIFFIIAACLVTWIATYSFLSINVESYAGKNDVFKKLSQVYHVVDNRYIGDIDEDKAMDALLSGYVDGIDKYGAYLNKTNYLDFKNDQTGKQSGIGAITKYDATSRYFRVYRVVEGSPCAKAGIKAGDIICKVDGVDLATLNYADAANKLKAAVGTELKLGILRGNAEELAILTVTEFKNPTVSYKLLPNGMGYIAIYEFIDEFTFADFKAAIEALQKQGASNFIFDVRNNTGGSLTSVVDILDYLLPKGTLCTVQDKSGEKAVYSSDSECIDGKFAVLINHDTYSGGELFAAAIRDFEYGTLVGQTTYGKGMAQDIIPLVDETALYLSTHLYYPPSGENYDGVGVAPDIEIQLSAEAEERLYELTIEEDLQIQGAIDALK